MSEWHDRLRREMVAAWRAGHGALDLYADLDPDAIPTGLDGGGAELVVHATFRPAEQGSRPSPPPERRYLLGGEADA
jgi:hypothetical protein